jgi:DNA processing protein
MSELRQVRNISGDVLERFLRVKDQVDPLELVERLDKAHVQAIPLSSEEYPDQLRHIHDPPLILYYKGKLHPSELGRSCAVVGTRHPTGYGQRLAKEFAFGLAEAGVSIISGMAIGVDSLAHRAALEAQGKTLAVFGCGTDICYPSSNRPLYQMLLQNENAGCVSEFFPGTKPQSWMFPARNRIISGLCETVCVIEAGESSGSLITARLAFEQNREVFAVPGRVDSPQSKGTHKIIASDMAHLVTSFEDIMKQKNWVTAPSGKEVPTVVELYGREKDVYELISNEPVHFDVLIERTGMPAGELSATLTMLELAGVVHRISGDWYNR